MDIDRKAADAADRAAVATDNLVTATAALVGATAKLADYTLYLVFVGAIGSILLVAQLGYLRRSVIDTGKAARAAYAQTRALIAIEQPIIVLASIGMRDDGGTVTDIPAYPLASRLRSKIQAGRPRPRDTFTLIA